MPRRRDVRRFGPGPYLLGLRRDDAHWGTGFPFTVPAVDAVEELRLGAPVTLLAGDNGTGKSTLIEAIAEAIGFAAEGGELERAGERPAVPRPAFDGALEPVLTSSKPRTGYFLRAESFFNIAKFVDSGGTFSPDISLYGGVPLHEQSHGESFLALAANRFAGEGLYVLDEPEAALSVGGALALLTVVATAARAGAQFVIATHSPILLACPGAAIYELTPPGSHRARTTTSTGCGSRAASCRRPSATCAPRSTSSRRADGGGTSLGSGPVELIERLLAIDVSALSDADKTLPVVEPAVRAMIPGVRMAGPAFTVVAADDHLPVMGALAEAAPGDVLVIATRGGTRAVFGELFATEAHRRGLAGIVADGLCRDLGGLRAIGLPVFARGTTPRSGTTVSRAPFGATITCGGVGVSPGDIVFGDDDGLLIAPAGRIAPALETAETIARAERAILAAQGRGEALHGLTNHAEHVAALDRGEASALAFRVDG